MKKSIFMNRDWSGQWPAPLLPVDLLDRNALEKRAVKIFDRRPNLVAEIESSLGPIVVKLFGWRSRIHYFLSPLMPSRAALSWRTARALRQAGSRTPAPIAVLTDRCLGLIQTNLFVCAAIRPHVTLRKFLKSGPEESAVLTVFADLALSLARMHNAGILHRDLTTGNFLVDSVGQVHIVDLNRARVLRRLTVRQRLNDLAKLNFGHRYNENQVLVTGFFTVYGNESAVAGDWEAGYRRARRKLQRYRRGKAALKRLFFKK
ncbi:MAG: lipopolysaccharide kinase InaA family protein [Candidatus Neomarinimicrobiota bacterium]